MLQNTNFMVSYSKYERGKIHNLFVVKPIIYSGVIFGGTLVSINVMYHQCGSENRLQQSLPAEKGNFCIANKQAVPKNVDTFNGKPYRSVKTNNKLNIAKLMLSFLGENKVYEYKNMFPERLKAEFNLDLRETLKHDPTVHNQVKAYQRVKSLSKYLKELMVGYITPDGEHWFEKAMPNILQGAVSEKIDNKKDFYNVAKEFWKLLANADDYWASTDFINYLKGMEQTPAIEATISAVNDMQIEDAMKKLTFTGQQSKIKFVRELYYCAYSGKDLSSDDDSTHLITLEHIFPRCYAGETGNSDTNYFITSAGPNRKRGSIPLIAYLKGWDDGEYNAHLQMGNYIDIGV
jgi:hypothetical protein